MNFTRPTSIVPSGERLVTKEIVDHNLEKLENGTLVYNEGSAVLLCKNLAVWIKGLNYHHVSLDEDKHIILSPKVDKEEFAFWYTVLEEPDWNFYFDPHYHKADIYVRANDYDYKGNAIEVTSAATPCLTYWRYVRMITNLFTSKRQFAFSDADVVIFKNSASSEAKEVSLKDYIVDIIYEIGCDNDFVLNKFSDDTHQYYVLTLRIDLFNESKLFFAEDSLAKDYFEKN